MEIGCTRSSHDLFLVRQAYHARYKKSLEEDVAYHTSGDFRKVSSSIHHPSMLISFQISYEFIDQKHIS